MTDIRWDLGPIDEEIPDFHVCEVERSAPGEPFVYVSAGASDVVAQPRVEFFLMAGTPDPLHVETLALVAHFHVTSRGGVDVGRVLDLGRPWCEGSTLHHFLVSVPYPYGPDFEYMDSPRGKVRFLWLMPISRQEADYASHEGAEALEDLLERHEVDVLDPLRHSVVQGLLTECASWNDKPVSCCCTHVGMRDEGSAGGGSRQRVGSSRRAASPNQGEA